MKVAVPTRENRVDDHFGHCEYYTVFTVENKKIISEEIIKSPEGCGCKSNIASILQEKGVSVMLAGNMGMGAYSILYSHGIEVIRGCIGEPHDIVNSFLNNSLEDNGIGCAGHGGAEGCHNH